MKHAICEHNRATSETSRIHTSFTISDIFQTEDASLESAKKILEFRYGKEYCEKLEYLSKDSMFDWYWFRNNHLDWEYSTITVKFVDIKKLNYNNGGYEQNRL